MINMINSLAYTPPNPELSTPSIPSITPSLYHHRARTGVEGVKTLNISKYIFYIYIYIIYTILVCIMFYVYVEYPESWIGPLFCWSGRDSCFLIKKTGIWPVPLLLCLRRVIDGIDGGDDSGFGVCIGQGINHINQFGWGCIGRGIDHIDHINQSR